MPSSVLTDSTTGRPGCVLLGIGLWQSFKSFDFDRSYDALNFSRAPFLERSEYAEKRLLGLSHELVGQVRSTYASAVRECLSIDMYRSRDKVQDIRCWKVAAALDQCMA